MRTPAAAAAAVLTTLLLVAGAAQAQAPTPTVSIQPKAGQSLQQLIYSGFSYSVTTNAEITFTAKLTMKYKGKTMSLTKGLRAETNYGQSTDPVEYSMPAVSEKVAKTLRKLKKATVKLTVVATGAGGYEKTLVKNAKLPHG
jgi:hypothetical protein